VTPLTSHDPNPSMLCCLTSGMFSTTRKGPPSHSNQNHPIVAHTFHFARLFVQLLACSPHPEGLAFAHQKYHLGSCITHLSISNGVSCLEHALRSYLLPLSPCFETNPHQRFYAFSVSRIYSLPTHPAFSSLSFFEKQFTNPSRLLFVLQRPLLTIPLVFSSHLIHLNMHLCPCRRYPT